MSRRLNWPLALAATALAACVFWFAASAHVQRACTVMDTPYLPLCPVAAPDAAATQNQLRQRIEASPGDAWAWTRLLVASGSAPPDGVIQAASVVAPNHKNVLRWRAAKALEQGDHAKGVEVLVQMVAMRGDGDAAKVLARIAQTPEGIALLRPHLGTARKWLPGVLAQMSAPALPPGRALPLVAAALEAGTMPEDARRAYMRSLKSSGQWLDAYGLWLSHHKDAVPLLYNAGFDQPLELDGFDWEFTPVLRSRTGVAISQASVARRGLILELEFTGRAFTAPILRQHVFFPPGSYRLGGDYASKLRSEGGLTWNVACTFGNQQVVGSSPPLPDTGGSWRRFQFDFTVPGDCGPVATLQLVPTATYEAAAGTRGQFSLDAFSLARTTR